MPKLRIGILTGGGDVPGLNSVIKSVVYRSSEHDCEVIGIRRGWEGLTHLDLGDPASRSRYVLPLTRENTRTRVASERSCSVESSSNAVASMDSIVPPFAMPILRPMAIAVGV